MSKVLTAAIALCLAVLPAASLGDELPPAVGQWKLSVETPNGLQNPVLTINAGDAGYFGTYASHRGTVELPQISVDGARFSFPMTVTIPIGTMEMQYEGTVSGDRLTGTIGNPRGKIPFSGERIVR